MPLRNREPAGPTILIADDDPAVLNFLDVALRREGYTVLMASSPEAALLVAASHVGPLHFLVTDVTMAGMSGDGLFSRLAVSHPEVRALCVSGYLRDDLISRGLLSQTTPFISKPFRLEELTAKLKELSGVVQD